MNTFFATLFKFNWANVGKAIVGGASGILTYPVIVAAVPILSPPVAIAIAVIIGAGSALGMHAVHLAGPPEVPIGDQTIESK